MGQMTQPYTNHSTEGQIISQPGQGPIPPGSTH